jgi:hypothetical protein
MWSQFFNGSADLNATACTKSDIKYHYVRLKPSDQWDRFAAATGFTRHRDAGVSAEDLLQPLTYQFTVINEYDRNPIRHHIIPINTAHIHIQHEIMPIQLPALGVSSVSDANVLRLSAGSHHTLTDETGASVAFRVYLRENPYRLRWETVRAFDRRGLYVRVTRKSRLWPG